MYPSKERGRSFCVFVEVSKRVETDDTGGSNTYEEEIRHPKKRGAPVWVVHAARE